MTSTVALTDYRPQAITGMAFGAMIMTMFGCMWLTWGLTAMNARSLWVVIAVALFATSLIVPGSRILQIGRKASKAAGPLTPEMEQEQKRMGMMFGIIFGGEGLLIFAAVNVLNNLHLGEYVISAIAAIVGLHFLPLARLYRLPMYYAVGGIMTAAAAASLALPASVRMSALAVTMSIIVWATCAIVIRKGFAMGRQVPAGQAR
jgi:hypothetical protein